MWLGGNIPCQDKHSRLLPDAESSYEQSSQGPACTSVGPPVPWKLIEERLSVGGLLLFGVSVLFPVTVLEWMHFHIFVSYLNCSVFTCTCGALPDKCSVCNRFERLCSVTAVSFQVSLIQKRHLMT